jgi:hypothetical protein
MRRFAFLMAFLSSSLVMAECPKDDKVCFDFAVGASPTAINLKTGALLMTLPLGVCFGSTYQPWQIGIDACANVQAATKTLPNAYTPSVQIHWRKFGTVGVHGKDRTGIVSAMARVLVDGMGKDDAICEATISKLKRCPPAVQLKVARAMLAKVQELSP